MKRFSIPAFILLIANVAIVFVTTDIKGQSSPSAGDIIEYIRISFKTANSKDLTGYMNEMVEIQLPDQDRNNYSKTQAEYVMRDFMKKYNPIDFKYIHKVLEKDDFKFTIGEYSYTGGIMRVTMVIKPLNGKYLIDSIVIEHK